MKWLRERPQRLASYCSERVTVDLLAHGVLGAARLPGREAAALPARPRRDVAVGGDEMGEQSGGDAAEEQPVGLLRPLQGRQQRHAEAADDEVVGGSARGNAQRLHAAGAELLCDGLARGLRKLCSQTIQRLAQVGGVSKVRSSSVNWPSRA